MRLISVIVPVYNVEPYLNQCIFSIVHQTYRDMEIILIDDGSTDNSGILCDKWREKDSRIVVIHQKNQGVAIARNTGLSVANGEWIAFVDSDDYLHSRMYEIMLEAIQKSNAQIVLCQEKTFVEKNQMEEEEFPTPCVFTMENREQYVSHFLDDFTGQYTWVWNKVYARELVGNKRFYDVKSMEDTFFSIDIAIEADRIVRLEERLYCYRQRRGSIMNQNNPQIMLDYKNSYLHVYEQIKASGVAGIQSKNWYKCLNRLANLEAEAFWRKEKAIQEEIKAAFIKLYDNKCCEVFNVKEKLKLFLARRFCYLYFMMKYSDCKKK